MIDLNPKYSNEVNLFLNKLQTNENLQRRFTNTLNATVGYKPTHLDILNCKCKSTLDYGNTNLVTNPVTDSGPVTDTDLNPVLVGGEFDADGNLIHTVPNDDVLPKIDIHTVAFFSHGRVVDEVPSLNLSEERINIERRFIGDYLNHNELTNYNLNMLQGFQDQFEYYYNRKGSLPFRYRNVSGGSFLMWDKTELDPNQDSNDYSDIRKFTGYRSAGLVGGYEFYISDFSKYMSLYDMPSVTSVELIGVGYRFKNFNVMDSSYDVNLIKLNATPDDMKKALNSAKEIIENRLSYYYSFADNYLNKINGTGQNYVEGIGVSKKTVYSDLQTGTTRSIEVPIFTLHFIREYRINGEYTIILDNNNDKYSGITVSLRVLQELVESGKTPTKIHPNLLNTNNYIKGKNDE